VPQTPSRNESPVSNRSPSGGMIRMASGAHQRFITLKYENGMFRPTP
jgi:hypothetical protein